MESLGVIKGAWSQKEDAPLRKCVEKYGEGKRHLVPPIAGNMKEKVISINLCVCSFSPFVLLKEFCFLEFAGLNRCRKSCRLRWVNYLKPNIKRGEFALDEVDLVIRLHNLLGNRQVITSLITILVTWYYCINCKAIFQIRRAPLNLELTKELFISWYLICCCACIDGP